MDNLKLLLFGLSFILFFIGMHDIDTAWNMMRYMALSGEKLVDCGAFFCNDPSNLYVMGSVVTLLGFIIMFVLVAVKKKNKRKDETWFQYFLRF